MTQVRVFAVSLNQTPLDWSGNFERMRQALVAAQGHGAEWVCFPELAVCGYGCEDAFLWPETWRRSWSVVEQLLPLTVGLVVSVGLPLPIEGKVYNASIVLFDGEIVGAVCKRHLARDGIHYEPRWFSPWPGGVAKNVELFGHAFPVGDLVFEFSGVRLAFEICEDAWVEERPAYELASQDVDFIFNPSASHFAFGKHSIRRQLVKAGAKCVRLGYVYCNLLGNEAGRAIYDGDCLICAAGEVPQIVAESRRFSFRDFQLAGATFDTQARVPATHSFESSPIEPYRRRLVTRPWSSSSVVTGVVTDSTPGVGEFEDLPKEQAFARAVALGLFDYLRKSGATGFVVSLSGGADSAAVSVLVRLMIRLAWAERGAGEVIQILSPGAGTQFTEGELAARLLTTVYQATKNSSETTRLAARMVARELGAEHHEVSVDDVVDAYRDKVEHLLGRELSWEKDDHTLQNVQARARAPLAWMVANAKRALLLATSNRSEAAVGYATMDGDTAGGLSPIAGVDKAFLRSWLVFMQAQGLDESGPFPQLAAINEQQPTAELRPQQYAQTDEADLMPYPVLDVIERAAFYQRRAPHEIFVLLVREMGIDSALALGWIERFFQLFSGNQWKRERLAPSFFLDEGNLDPRSWLRFPILSGGFDDELRELRARHTERT